MKFHFFSSSSLPLTLFCLFFIMPGFPVSQSIPELYENEQNYENCHDALFKCGDMHAGYPFYGGDRVKECGHRELKLLCDHPTNITTINILGVNYQVLGIQHDRLILRISESKELVMNEVLCPLRYPGPDSILDFQVLTPGHNFTNVTLFLDCPLPPRNISSGLRVFPCLHDDYDGMGVTVAIANNTHPEGCSANLTVSILQTSWERVCNYSLDLEQAFQTEFEVRWKEDKAACSNCNVSGGECGFGKEDQTVCYCPLGSWPPDYPKFSKCNHPPPQSPSQSPTGSIPWSKQHRVLIGMAVAAIVLVSSICFVVLRFKRKSLSNHLFPEKMKDHAKIEAFITNFGSLAPRRYSYAEIKKMTHKFNHKLGQGGYGCVYKGKLPDGRLVAVKLLSESKGNGEDFMNEVASISRTSHVNVVTLLGYCFERSKRALVYEFMLHGSLDKFIYSQGSDNKSRQLEWKTLYDIALGIARGLEYLHQGCNTRILHFDIKPHNILLDENFCPKIADFGLSKLCERKESIISMACARGTIGYIAPEVFCRNFGGVSYKSDVYSYGMMVLEVVGGRKNIDLGVCESSEVYFPSWIYKHLGQSMKLSLDGVAIEDEEITRKLIIVSLWCIQNDPSDRPTMTEVLEMLQGSLESLVIPPRPFVSSPVPSPSICNGTSSTS